jgi:quercetin dioxygenase-like cupin family protein
MQRNGLVTTVNVESTLISCDMDAFPEFMKHPANRIVRSNQATPGVEGYVFDGANGSQMAFWTCGETATSAEHVHGYDEYVVVVQGCYTLVIHGKRIAVKAGEEYFIPRGVPHSGEVAAGTRTIHAFGGHRADRGGECNLLSTIDFRCYPSSPRPRRER